jgi:hypothetical protein
LLLIPFFAQNSCTRAAGTRAIEMAPRDKMLDDSKLSVSLRTMLVGPSGERPVEESETLHSGDRVYFVVRTSQAAYVYVILFGPDGSASVLFPPAGSQEPGAPPPLVDQAIAARCPLRLPAQGTFFLKSPAGPEDVRVVASLQPLAVADRRLCEQLRLPCQSGLAPTPAPTPAPAPCPAEGARAIFSSVRVATASKNGVAALRLTLRHDP